MSALSILISTALAATTTTATTTTTVSMKSISFEPKAVSVHVGDKVEWKNISYTHHSATSDEGVFETGMVEPKKSSKAIEFSKPGTFKYHCSVHGKTMSGTIEVKP